MAEDTADRDTLNSELMNPGIPAAREERNAVFIPKCIKDKKYTLAAIAVITALVITIIALAAEKPQPCPLCPPPVDAACPERWVGYQGKCYYTSEDKRNWNDSESRCSSLGASLAVIDTKLDLDFLWTFTRPSHYWIGLSREAGQPWKWPNGTEFGNQAYQPYPQFTVWSYSWADLFILKDHRARTGNVWTWEQDLLCEEKAFAHT